MSEKSNTIVISSRLDIRDVAVLATYLEKIGKLPSTKSLLIRAAVESLVQLLIRDNFAEAEESHLKAYKIMELLGFSHGKKGKRNLMDAISKEATAERLGTKEEAPGFDGLFE